MCEEFARKELERCPADITQRLKDGLGHTLSVLSPFCEPAFDFNKLMLNPTDLPVVFSSESYQSPDLVLTTVPRAPVPQITEYWFGSLYGLSDTMFARSGSNVHYYAKGPRVWILNVEVGKSVPGLCLMLYGPDTNDIISLRTAGGEEVIGHIPGATLAQMSGDGSKYFVRDDAGWRRYEGVLEWVSIGYKDPTLQLSVSLHGDSFVYITGSDLLARC